MSAASDFWLAMMMSDGATEEEARDAYRAMSEAENAEPKRNEEDEEDD